MVPRTLGVIGCLILSLTAVSVWGQSQASDHAKSTTPASNIEGWHEGNGDEDSNPWTWFGMSYELRNAAIRSGNSIASGISIKRANGKK